MSGAPPPPEAASRPRGADPDSRARTHLANERTFLAWLRTGLSLVAVGMAAASFLPFDLIPGIPYVTLFSILLVVAGIAVVLMGASRYTVAHQQIEASAFDPTRKPLVAIAVLVALLSVLAIPMIVQLR